MSYCSYIFNVSIIKRYTCLYLKWAMKMSIILSLHSHVFWNQSTIPLILNKVYKLFILKIGYWKIRIAFELTHNSLTFLFVYTFLSWRQFTLITLISIACRHFSLYLALMVGCWDLLWHLFCLLLSYKTALSWNHKKATANF